MPYLWWYVNIMIGIYAGRFQPFHNGHLGAIKHIINKCDETYILICNKKGDNPWDDRNPFTFEERKNMIELTLGKAYPLVHFRNIKDQESDAEWTRVIETEMPKGRKVSFTNNPHTATAFRAHGYEVNQIPVQNDGLNATGIRKLIIRNEPWKQHVPFGTITVIDNIQKGSYSVETVD